MTMADELERLNALHERGALTTEEFALAKKRLLEAAPGATASASTSRPEPSMLSRLHRSLTDRWIGGVSGGLGELTGVPSWTWRILFVLTAFLHGLGAIMYVLLWIFVPVQAVVPKPVVVVRE